MMIQCLCKVQIVAHVELFCSQMFLYLGFYICYQYLNIQGGLWRRDSGDPLTTYCKFTAKRFQLRACIPPGLVRDWRAVQVVSLPLSMLSAAIGSSTHRSPDLEEIALVFSALVAMRVHAQMQYIYVLWCACF